MNNNIVNFSDIRPGSENHRNGVKEKAVILTKNRNDAVEYAIKEIIPL